MSETWEIQKTNVLLSGKQGGKGLTRSAFVPDNEVFTAARTLVRPKHAAVDKDVTAPSVLALVQHFLKKEKMTASREKQKKLLGEEQ